MNSLSVSFTLGKASVPHGANVEHNNRKFIAPNINKDKISQNITYVSTDIELAYKHLFDNALQLYNSKQSQPCRRIKDYYHHISNSKREEAFYEIIVQFGDCNTASCDTQQGHAVKKMLDDYMKNFQTRNPNLHVFNAVLHMDEACPHLHIDFIPFYTASRKNGLSKGVSLKSALNEQGFSAQNFKQNRLVAWEESERNFMQSILNKYGYDREIKNAKYKHMNVQDFKNSKDELNAIKIISDMKKVSPQDLNMEYVRNLKTKIFNLEYENKMLLKEKNSPYKSLFFSDPDKQMFIQDKLDNLQIPYFENEYGLQIQECFLEKVRSLEKEYKPIKSTIRDTLRSDIDRLLMQSKTVAEILYKLQEENYTLKMGKYISVKPQYGKQFIRLHSLGENYSQVALKNRLLEKDNYTKKIDERLKYVKFDTEQYLVQTIKVYTIAMKKGDLPMRKKVQQKPFSWNNDKELDKLTSLNDKINKGLNLEKLREHFKALEEDIVEKEKILHKSKLDVDRIQNLKEQIEIIFENKSSNRFSKEQALLTIQKYPSINSSTYKNIEKLVFSTAQDLKNAEEDLSLQNQKLKEVVDDISILEKIVNGSYVQFLVNQEKNLRDSISNTNKFDNYSSFSR